MRLLERLEDALLIGWRNAGAGIRHGDREVSL
jgi:hypothetical protein